MSLHDYQVGQHIESQHSDDDFYGLIQACMRLADDDNLAQLKAAWPETWSDLQARYFAPGGILPGEETSK